MDVAITINPMFLWCLAGAITWICAFVWMWKQKQFFIPASIAAAWCVALVTSFEWYNSHATFPNIAAIGMGVIAVGFFVATLVSKYDS